MVSNDGLVLRKDGKYLRYREYTTHTGEHRTLAWVDDLHEATVFRQLPRNLREAGLREAGLYDVEQLQVTETRIVTLLAHTT